MDAGPPVRGGLIATLLSAAQATPRRLLTVIVVGAAAALGPTTVVVAAVGAGVVVLVTLSAPIAGVVWAALAVSLGAILETRAGDLPAGPADAAALLLVGIWGVRLATRRETRLVVPGVALAVAPLVVVLTLESTLAASLAIAGKATLRWLELGAVALATANVLRDVRKAWIAIGAIAMAATAQSALGAIQFVTRWGPPSFAIGPFLRAHGTFGQPNPFGGYLAMCVPLLVVVTMMGWRVLPMVPRLALAGASALTLAAIGMSLSRGAWIGLMAAAVVIALAWSRRAALVAGAAGLAGAGALIASGTGVLPESVQLRLAPALAYLRVFDARGVVPTPDTFAIVERMAHWQAAAEMFVDHPLLGVGPGHYVPTYPDYAILPYWREPLGHAHNVYLNVAAESGLIGLIGFVGMLAIWWLLWVRTVRRPWPDGTWLARATAIGVGGCLTAAMAHNLFDNLFVHGLNVHVGLLLGLLAWSASAGGTTGDDWQEDRH